MIINLLVQGWMLSAWRHTYDGETLNILEIRKTKHGKPEAAQHLANNPTHTFTWKIVCFVKSTLLKWKITEGLTTDSERPTLNKQVNCFIAKLFPSWVFFFLHSEDGNRRKRLF